MSGHVLILASVGGQGISCKGGMPGLQRVPVQSSTQGLGLALGPGRGIGHVLRAEVAALLGRHLHRTDAERGQG